MEATLALGHDATYHKTWGVVRRLAGPLMVVGDCPVQHQYRHLFARKNPDKISVNQLRRGREHTRDCTATHDPTWMAQFEGSLPAS